MAAIPATGPVADFCACCGCAACGDCYYCHDNGEDIECVFCSQDDFNAALGCSLGDPCYDGRYDFDDDGDVDFSDLGEFRRQCTGCL